MIRWFLCMLLMINVLDATGQIALNNPVDPADTELVNAVGFLNKYLNEFTFEKKTLPDFSQYWSREDCNAFRIPDQMLYAINTSIPTYMLGKPTILSAKPVNGYVQIKTMFSKADTSGKVLVMAITNHYIKKGAAGQLCFINPMDLKWDDWRSRTVRAVTYFYPAYHHFDKKKASALMHKIMDLEKEWGIPTVPVRYYFADTKEEIEHYRGFDFTIAMGNRDKPSGMSDGIDNIVYCGGWGENYFHEIVHLYLNKYFPQSPLTEGLAVFYGGSLGHELGWHVERLKQYLHQHPEINLNHLDDFYYMDNFTNPTSTILGLLCYTAYNQGGLTGLKRTLNYPSIEDLLLKEYHVGRDGWDTFLRKLIDDTSATAEQ